VVRFVCDHKSGMNNDEPWWLVILWQDIDMRGDVSSRLVIRAGTDLTCEIRELSMDVGINLPCILYVIIFPC